MDALFEIIIFDLEFIKKHTLAVITTVRGVAIYRTVPPELLTLAANADIHTGRSGGISAVCVRNSQRCPLSVHAHLRELVPTQLPPTAADHFPLFSFECGLTYSRQLRSPLSRAIISASAVAMFVATGIL